MELQLQRQAPIGDALPGLLAIDGVFFSYTLERLSLAIAAGRHRVTFTVSERATTGELWSPDRFHRLPLIDDGIQRRTGIRIHSANFEYELLGCVAVGKSRNGPQLLNSRNALIPLIGRIAAVDAAHEEIWITVLDSGATPTT